MGLEYIKLVFGVVGAVDSFLRGIDISFQLVHETGEVVFVLASEVCAFEWGFRKAADAAGLE